jgi:hypothetical protein
MFKNNEKTNLNFCLSWCPWCLGGEIGFVGNLKR